jgi:hypothetical protein
MSNRPRFNYRLTTKPSARALAAYYKKRQQAQNERLTFKLSQALSWISAQIKRG